MKMHMEKVERSLPPLVLRYLKKFNYRVDNTEFKQRLVSNPSFPSVGSVTDTFDFFGIANLSAKVAKGSYGDLPEHLLVVLSRDTSCALAWISKAGDHVKVRVEDGSEERITVDEFQALWNGMIVAVEQGSHKSGLRRWRPAMGYTFLSVLAMAAIGKGVAEEAWLSVTYSVLLSLGLLMSFFLSQQELGRHIRGLSRICDLRKIKLSCSDVINSRFSTIWKSVTLADLALTFFVSSLLIAALVGFNATYFFGLSLSTLPFIVYTVWVQRVLLKKWCPLCLGLVVVLISMMSLGYWAPKQFVLPWGYATQGILIFAGTLWIWSGLKRLLLRSEKLLEIQTELLTLKRNDVVLQALLSNSNLPLTIPQRPDTRITFGDPDAQLTITLVTNPLCGHCTKVFEQVEALLQRFSERLQLNIVLNVNVEDKGFDFQFGQSIVLLYKVDKEKAYEALKAWYRQRKPDWWLSKYSSPPNDLVADVLRHHLDWCHINKIQYVPTVLLEDYLFPDLYDIDDLSHLVPDLLEKPELLSSKAPVDVTLKKEFLQG